MTTEIRRGNARFTTRNPGRLTRHALSFGPHYDPDRLRFGPLVCHDDHVLGGGRGFEEHPHADLEIVSWVIAGGVDHRDSLGTERHLSPGSVAVLSAGAGVEHAETATPGLPCRFVQVWLVPDQSGLAPSYAAVEVDPATLAGRLGLVASGSDPAAPVRVGTAGATLQVARLAPGESVTLGDDSPTGSRRHVYVATGALARSSLAEPLTAGDAYQVEDAAATAPATLTAAVPTELMVWTFA